MYTLNEKVDKKLSKKLSKSCQKAQNSTNCGGVGEIVVPRPSASASLTGRRQKGVNYLGNSKIH
jgi:hypothetical protein